MKLIFKIIAIYLFSLNAIAREEGETEITTENGIEVFQNEKYYLLKQNVKIESDRFFLNADDVKVKFEESLYDINELEAKGSVYFNSEELDMEGKGEFLNIKLKIEKIKIQGKGSELNSKDIQMFSDDLIEVNNVDGNFKIQGLNSKLINENIIIKGQSIDGIFINNNDKMEITYLNVVDNYKSYVKNIDTEMYAKKINFNNKTSIIELIDNVEIIRNGERIKGDYGTLDTKNNSYKIKSNNTDKVIVIIQNNE